MKIAVAVFADFAETFLGGPSRLLTPLAGAPVLGHTLRRALRVEGADHVALFVRERDAAPAAEALRRLELSERVTLLPADRGLRPRRNLIRAARKWSLGSWRGGPVGATFHDEYIEPLCAGQVLDHFGCEAVLCLDGHMAAHDPAIGSAMLRRLREIPDEARFLFTQAPPGLAGFVLRREMTRELLEQNVPLGVLLSYRPEMPAVDPITRAGCLHIDRRIAQQAARLTADTTRAVELLEGAFTAHGADADAAKIVDWLSADPDERGPAGFLPVEVELELTTDDPLPRTRLRPRGERVPRRELRNFEAVDRLAAALARQDDRLIVLGGHGDPLRHPAFGEVCQRLRAGGVCGVAVTTPLVDLTDAAIDGLFAAKVDVVEVLLDADSAATYAGVNGADLFSRVLANIDRLEAARRERNSPQPILIPTLTRCADNVHEIETFVDRWIRRLGSAVIRGFDDRAGLLPADSLLGTTPPVRRPCRRLAQRMMLLADGTVPFCSTDVRGETSLGDWTTTPIDALWRSDGLRSLRAAHAALALDAHALCRRCSAWHRP